MVALLNEPLEASVCLKMIHAVDEQATILNGSLVTTVLDREQYLLKIGATKELEVVKARLQQIYDSNFKK